MQLCVEVEWYWRGWLYVWPGVRLEWYVDHLVFGLSYPLEHVLVLPDNLLNVVLQG